MPNSTALAYRQFQAINNSGTGAGSQWLHVLWHLYRYLFVDAEAVDSGRWRLVDSSPSAGSWTTLSNIVDNSWFVVECFTGRRRWQAKFQASNVAALDESPATSYTLIVSMCNTGGWTTKGGTDGGFEAGTTTFSGNKRLGGTDITGADGAINVHGDRDTLLIAVAHNNTSDYASGGYIGRFDPFLDEIPYPECILGCWDGTGSPKGFDRSAGGAFGETPGDSFALAFTGTSVTCKTFTPGWLVGARQPDPFTSQYHYRPLELAISNSPLGYLRNVWACAGMAPLSRMDYRRKLVLGDGDLNATVAVHHNGLLFP